MRGILPLTLPILVLLAAPAVADDWPQWMGPDRDSVWKESGIIAKFPAGGPKKLWSVEVGGGYAGPAVAGGKVYVTDRQLGKGQKNPSNPFDDKTAITGTERILCFDAKTGAEIWKHEYPCEYKVSYASGPRCTPAVKDGKVYSLGTMGDFYCLDAEKGTEIWKKDFKTAYNSQTPVWGFTGHPLVYKNMVICLVGGEGSLVVAFNKDTGSEVWKALSPAKPRDAGYAPPTIVYVDGKAVLLMFHPAGVTALDPDKGTTFWTVPLKPDFAMSIMAPRKSGDLVYVGGHGHSMAIKLDDKPEAAWRGGDKAGIGIAPINMTPFVEGNTIYGVDGNGALRAADLTTGKRLWYTFEPVLDEEKEESFKGAGSGTAFLVKHAPTERFFIFNEKGSLIIATLTPQGPTIIDRAKLIEPTSGAFGRKVVWSHPAFAGKCIFVRNDNVLACFSLAEE